MRQPIILGKNDGGYTYSNYYEKDGALAIVYVGVGSVVEVDESFTKEYLRLKGYEPVKEWDK